MDKVVVGLGIVSLILGAIVFIYFVLGIPTNVNPFSYFHVSNILLVEQALASTFAIVLGCILIFWGIKKR